MCLGCFGETITLAATDPSRAPSGVAIKLAEAEHIGDLARGIGLKPIALQAESETTAAPDAATTPSEQKSASLK